MEIGGVDTDIDVIPGWSYEEFSKYALILWPDRVMVIDDEEDQGQWKVQWGYLYKNVSFQEKASKLGITDQVGPGVLVMMYLPQLDSVTLVAASEDILTQWLPYIQYEAIM
jgi:hypothetical protein